MIIDIIPLASETGGAAAARKEFQSVLDDRFRVVEIVYGPHGAPIDAIIEIGTAAARQDPARCVLWCREPEVLSVAQRNTYMVADKKAVFYRFGETLTAALDADEAQSLSTVLDAFEK